MCVTAVRLRLVAAALLGVTMVALGGRGASGAPFVDDFNRPDNSYLGQEWIEQAYDWSIVAGGACSSIADVPALMTLTEFRFEDPHVAVTVHYTGEPAPTYAALVLLHKDNEHCIFVKVQDGYDGSPPDGLFDTAWFYLGNNSMQGWGAYQVWEDIGPYFSEARLTAWVDADTVFLAIDRDFDGAPDGPPISRGGIPVAGLGDGVGLGGYNAAVADDFFAVPEPAAAVLVGAGLVAMAAGRVKRRARRARQTRRCPA